MMAENLDAFFNTDELGVEAVYNTATITVQLFNEYLTIEGGTLGVEGTSPAVLCKASDVSGIVADDAITVGSVDYTVIRIEPDSTGTLYRLILTEA